MAAGFRAGPFLSITSCPMRENFPEAIAWHRAPYINVTHNLGWGKAGVDLFGGGRAYEDGPNQGASRSTDLTILNSFYSCSLPGTQARDKWLWDGSESRLLPPESSFAPRRVWRCHPVVARRKEHEIQSWTRPSLSPSDGLLL